MGMYERGIQEIMAGNIDLVNDRINALLIDTTAYTPDLSGDAVQADIPADAQIVETILEGNTLDGTTFRADDVTFPAATGTAGAVVIFQDTGDFNSSKLLAYLTSPDWPVSLESQQESIQWDTGENGIFRL